MTPLLWRSLPYLDASGAVQMAIDDWLFRQLAQGKTLPTLRFYGWTPAAISLGRFQKTYPEHWANLTWQGQPLELVTRPSGGRAVLHQGTLTYAIICERGSGKRWETYHRFCDALRLGWQRLGISLQYGTAQRGYIGNTSCFNTATAADLVALDGSKLIGSAQRLSHRALLQHGSMVLSSDRHLFATVFEQSAPWTQTLGERLGAWQLNEIISVLTQAIAESFGVTLIEKPLSDQDWQAITRSVKVRSS
ncbi:MAG: biotin/lipoate A/B protein ligase family protein [Microcystaceae cyanobacterium]